MLSSLLYSIINDVRAATSLFALHRIEGVMLRVSTSSYQQIVKARSSNSFRVQREYLNQSWIRMGKKVFSRSYRNTGSIEIGMVIRISDS